jgi:uncharacterized protein (DUF736 family)
MADDIIFGGDSTTEESGNGSGSSNRPALSNDTAGVAAWPKISSNGQPYLSIRIDTGVLGEFDTAIFPETDAARAALEKLARADQ